MRRSMMLFLAGCAGASTGSTTCDEAAADPAERDVSGWVAAPGDACRREVLTPAGQECAEITVAYATDDGRCWWFSCYLSPPSALATVGQTTTTAQTLPTDGGGTCDLTAMAALPACDEPVLLCTDAGAVTEVAVAP